MARPGGGGADLRGLAASALAALDDYGTAAFGFALGGGRRARRDRSRSSATASSRSAGGSPLNGALALAVPLVGAASRGAASAASSADVAGRGSRELAEGVALPFALQGLYVIGDCASRSGLGDGRARRPSPTRT